MNKKQRTAQRVHNRFGGMRDSAIFLWWYAGCELKTGAGSGNFDSERERDFLLLRAWDAGKVNGKVAGYGIWQLSWSEACQIYPLSPFPGISKFSTFSSVSKSQSLELPFIFNKSPTRFVLRDFNEYSCCFFFFEYVKQPSKICLS